MMRYIIKPLLLTCLVIFPGSALAGWGSHIGSLLTSLPVIDAVGVRILDNRIAYIGSRESSKQKIFARVRLDLGARANIRDVPSTKGGSKVIAQLSPGEDAEVVSAVKGEPWLEVKLRTGKRGFIYQNLVTLSR